MKSKKIQFFAIILNKGELKFRENGNQRRKPPTLR